MPEYIKSIENTAEGIILVSNKNVYVTASGKGLLHIKLNGVPVEQTVLIGRILVNNRFESRFNHIAVNGKFIPEFFTGYQFILDYDDLLEIGLKKDP